MVPPGRGGETGSVDLTVTPTPEGQVLRVAGDVGAAGALVLREELWSLLGRGAVIAVELGAVGALSSYALGVLADAVARAGDIGGELTIVGARARLAPTIAALQEPGTLAPV